VKKILILIAVFTAFTSCKKSTENRIIEPVYVPDTKVAVSRMPQITNKPDLVWSSTANVLGHGYDVTGKHDDLSAVRAQAIDADAFAKQSPDGLITSTSTSAAPFVVFSKDAANFVTKFPVPSGLENEASFFKGTITSSFPEKDAFSSKYVYANYSLISQTKSLGIYYTDRHDYLTPVFTQDLLKMSSADLIGKYGTHVLTRILLGQKINVVYQAVANNEIDAGERQNLAGANFTVALKNVFGLSTGRMDDPAPKLLASVSSQKIVYDAVGGDVSKLIPDPRFEIPKINITEWSHSLTVENSVFIGVGGNENKKGLISLDQLIADPVKKAEVKAYINKYIVDQQVKLIN
jgi:hypothetical protein